MTTPERDKDDPLFWFWIEGYTRLLIEREIVRSKYEPRGKLRVRTWEIRRESPPYSIRMFLRTLSVDARLVFDAITQHARESRSQGFFLQPFEFTPLHFPDAKAKAAAKTNIKAKVKRRTISWYRVKKALDELKERGVIDFENAKPGSRRLYSLSNKHVEDTKSYDDKTPGVKRWPRSVGVWVYIRHFSGNEKRFKLPDPSENLVADEGRMEELYLHEYVDLLESTIDKICDHISKRFKISELPWGSEGFRLPDSYRRFWEILGRLRELNPDDVAESIDNAEWLLPKRRISLVRFCELHELEGNTRRIFALICKETKKFTYTQIGLDLQMAQGTIAKGLSELRTKELIECPLGGGALLSWQPRAMIQLKDQRVKPIQGEKKK